MSNDYLLEEGYIFFNKKNGEIQGSYNPHHEEDEVNLNKNRIIRHESDDEFYIEEIKDEASESRRKRMKTTAVRNIMEIDDISEDNFER